MLVLVEQGRMMGLRCRAQSTLASCRTQTNACKVSETYLRWNVTRDEDEIGGQLRPVNCRTLGYCDLLEDKQVDGDQVLVEAMQRGRVK